MQLTLRRKFALGFVAVCVVVVSAGLSIRLMGKAALFHHLERDHLAEVMQTVGAVDRVLDGGKSAGSVARREVVGHVLRGRELAQQAISELFAVEKSLFELIGFGEVLAQPLDVIAATRRIEATLVAEPGTQLVVAPYGEQGAPMAEAVLALLHDRARAQAIAVAARQRVEARYGWEPRSDELLGMLTEASESWG